MDSGPHAMLEKHVSYGRLLDSNILLFFLIGNYDRKLIEKFKRTSTFTEKIFVLLCDLLSPVSRMITTAHILTEVSKLSGSLTGHRRQQFFHLFAQSIKVFDELSIESKSVVEQESFITHGLTDAAIVSLINVNAAKQKHLVLIADLPLYLLLSRDDLNVINFNHLRQY